MIGAMNTAGLVLAAGESRRFGSPKQLALFRGRPLVEWAVRALLGGPLSEVVVVLGAHAHAIQSAVAVDGVRFIVAADWAEGQSASLREGLGAIGACDAAVILLADQPLVTAAAVCRVCASAEPGRAARATYHGQPGHPTLIPRDLWPAIQALEGDSGAAAILRADGFVPVPCEDIASPSDADTLSSLAEVEEEARRRGFPTF